MGYPDLATRVLLGRLAKDFPFLLILGLFDWDPHGLQVLNFCPEKSFFIFLEVLIHMRLIHLSVSPLLFLLFRNADFLNL